MEDNTLTFNKNDKTYNFHILRASDHPWIIETFGSVEEFQKNITDFDRPQILSATLYTIMHHLLINELSLDEFTDQMGTGYNDVSELYYHFNTCVGNSQKEVKKASKLVNKNWKLKKENRRLQHLLLVEKVKNFKRAISG